MVNTTFQVGLPGWSESSRIPNLGSVRSETLVLENLSIPSQTRNSHPGTRPLLRLSSFPRQRGNLASLRWNLCVCNTYSNPLQTGLSPELSVRDDILLVALTSAIRQLMPDWPLRDQELQSMRLWISRQPVTEFLHFWSPKCCGTFLILEGESSHVEVPEQLSLAGM